MATATGAWATIEPGRRSAIIEAIADGFRNQPRAPLLKTPANAGLDYEDWTFPSEDGVPLEAWFIPNSGSDRLLIVNHPRGFNRYGCPSHLEPWRSVGAMGGNDFEVDFILDLRLLHDAGYNVLTYDLRNHGHSGSANGGLITSGRFESRVVIGAMAFCRSQPRLRHMSIGLFSRCMGCNSTMFAMARRPELFEGVRCLVGVQPVSPRSIMSKILDLVGVGSEHIEQLEERIRLVTSFALEDLSPARAAHGVTIPTLLYQVREDIMTDPNDVQTIFDAIGSRQKDLFWIEGTTRRWDGYTHFAKEPERIVAWFDAHFD